MTGMAFMILALWLALLNEQSQRRKLRNRIEKLETVNEPEHHAQCAAISQNIHAAALARYTSHREGCSHGENNICTCGLSQLLEQLNQPKP